jgi:hypothetical protein
MVSGIERGERMKRLETGCVSCVLGILLASAACGAEADRDPWAALRFLIGEWTGEGGGQPGQSAGGFTFRPELGGKVLVRRNRAEIARGPDRPAAVHEDLMVVYPGEKGQPARAIYWDNEGHVINYAVRPAPDGKSASFLSEPVPGQPRFRLTYQEMGDNRVDIVFAIAPPGKPDEFRTYLEAKARRTPRSNVGLSLPRGYVSHRAAGPIAVDGKLDEASWRNVPWTEPFLDIEGDLKPVPRLETRCKMLWDDEYFYVAAYLEEPHVWGTLTKHDSVIFQDNDFEIFIDPDGDNHEYYELEINALNTEWDLFLKKPYRDGGPALNEWEVPGLKTGVHVSGTLNDPRDNDQGWTVEFALPWKVLAEYAHRPTPPREGDQWRINFSRVEWEHEIKDGKYAKIPNRREDNWVWSPQGVVDMHRPEFWGFVQFSAAPPGSDAFRPDPAQPIRERLIDVYNLQKLYQAKHQRWADSLEALGWSSAAAAQRERPLTLRPTHRGFEASITCTPEPGGRAQTWSIDQESRLSQTPSDR